MGRKDITYCDRCFKIFKTLEGNVVNTAINTHEYTINANKMRRDYCSECSDYVNASIYNILDEVVEANRITIN